MPHSALSSWSSKDLQLHIADLIVRDDLGRCGHPHSVSTAPGAVDRYEVKADRVCGACARLDEYEKAHEGHGPGVLLRVVDLVAEQEAAESGPDEFGPTFD